MTYPRDDSIASRIKRAGLPTTYDVHWSENRKARVVEAVRGQLISMDEARDKYLLSRSEFESWKDQFGGSQEQDPAEARELELH